MMTFDFLDHHLAIETSDGMRRTLPLAPRSVADFYREVVAPLLEDTEAIVYILPEERTLAEVFWAAPPDLQLSKAE